MKYRLFGPKVGSLRDRARERRAAHFRLKDEKGENPQIIYVERDGSKSWCL